MEESKTEQILSLMREAWPVNRFNALGPKQKALLKANVMLAKHPLTVPSLEGMLEMVEEYFPEILINSEGSLKQHLQIGSPSLG
jgi:hypothetical protein